MKEHVRAPLKSVNLLSSQKLYSVRNQAIALGKTVKLFLGLDNAIRLEDVKTNFEGFQTTQQLRSTPRQLIVFLVSSSYGYTEFELQQDILS